VPLRNYVITQVYTIELSGSSAVKKCSVASWPTGLSVNITRNFVVTSYGTMKRTSRGTREREIRWRKKRWAHTNWLPNCRLLIWDSPTSPALGRHIVFHRRMHSVLSDFHWAPARLFIFVSILLSVCLSLLRGHRVAVVWPFSKCWLNTVVTYQWRMATVWGTVLCRRPQLVGRQTSGQKHCC